MTRVTTWTALAVGVLGGLSIVGTSAAMATEPADLHDVLGSG